MFSSLAYIRKNLETCLSYVTAPEELALHNTIHTGYSVCCHVVVFVSASGLSSERKGQVMT